MQADFIQSEKPIDLYPKVVRDIENSSNTALQSNLHHQEQQASICSVCSNIKTPTGSANFKSTDPRVNRNDLNAADRVQIKDSKTLHDSLVTDMEMSKKHADLYPSVSKDLENSNASENLHHLQKAGHIACAECGGIAA